MSDSTTLTELYFSSIDQFGNRPVAMRSRLSGSWVDLSYAELADRVEAFSLGLLELGVQAGQHVAILSENRPEWAIADYACLAARCADVPIYPTLPPRQIEYVLRDSESVVVCVSNAGQLAKVEQIRGNLPQLRHVIVFDKVPAGSHALWFDEIVTRGREARSRYPNWKADALKARPEDLATLIYTSGTTGEPKGVMLTHGNIASNVGGDWPSWDCATPTSACRSFPYPTSSSGWRATTA